MVWMRISQVGVCDVAYSLVDEMYRKIVEWLRCTEALLVDEMKPSWCLRCMLVVGRDLT